MSGRFKSFLSLNSGSIRARVFVPVAGGQRRVQITNVTQTANDTTITLKGGHAFGLLAAESGIPNRIIIEERSGSRAARGKRQTRAIELSIEPLTQPHFEFDGTGLRPAVLDGSQGISLNLADGNFRLPGGTDGQVTVSRDNEMATPSNDSSLNNLTHERLRRNLEHYMNQILVRTILPELNPTP